MAIIDGINEIAEARGYNTILNNLRLLSKIESQFEHISNYQEDIDKAVDVMIGMQVDGIIYVGMHDRKINHVLHDIKKPVVYCYCYTDGEGSSVRYSNEKTVYQMTQMLINNGHKELGLKIPDDISVTGFDNADIVHYMTPRVTTVERPLQEMGYRSMELLLESIHGTSVGAVNKN